MRFANDGEVRDYFEFGSAICLRGSRDRYSVKSTKQFAYNKQCAHYSKHYALNRYFGVNRMPGVHYVGQYTILK